MVITEAQLKRAVPNVSKERVWEFVKAWNKYSEQFEINTPLRTVHALAQFFCESSALNRLEENLNYSVKRLRQVFPKYFKTDAEAAAYAYKPMQIANRVYANRMGNGNEASGDGYRYRGRGVIQLTGRNNLLAYERSGYCVGKVTEHPEWLTQFPGALKSAMWYWKANGCNALADKDDINAVTKRINGGLNGLSDRAYYLRRFKREFGF